MEFSRQEYWSGLPFPSPGDISDPGMEPGFPALQENSSPSEQPGIDFKECLSLSLSVRNGRLSISGWECLFLFLVSEEFF